MDYDQLKTGVKQIADIAASVHQSKVCGVACLTSSNVQAVGRDELSLCRWQSQRDPTQEYDRGFQTVSLEFDQHVPVGFGF
jgi:hypothetical protein